MSSPDLLEAVAPERLPELWPKVAPFIKDALAFNPGDLGLADIAELVMRGRMQLWVLGNVRAACVTELVVYPRRKVCRLVTFAGDLKRARRLEEQMAAWATSQGATQLEIIGRRGWARTLKAAGWREVATIVRKDIA